MIRFACALLLSAASSFAADLKPVTLDTLMTQHYPSLPNPIWAPDGLHFAVVSQNQVKLYDSTNGQSKNWFNVDTLSSKAARPDSDSKPFGWRNRRVSSDSFQWASDGKSMLAAVEGDLFLVHLNGKVQQLTHTETDEEDPKISPDGTRILYRSQSNLYVLDVAKKKVQPLTTSGTATLLNGQLDWVYPEELDLGSAAWWSPDSRKIAFMQFDVSKEFVYPQADLIGLRAEAEPERYPQAGTPNAQVHVGVIDLDSGETKWMNLGDTSNSLLARVIWMPDSDTLAVERLSRVQDKLELLFCRSKTGSVETILKEVSKTWINFTDNFYPIANGSEFLWTSESGPGGFRHIYRYSAKGELLNQVTQGEWEVRGIAAVDETHKTIYYASSEESPLQTQLYSVAFGGGPSKRITSEPGTHVIHADPMGKAFVDVFSSFEDPPQASLKNSSGEKIAVLTPPDRTVANEYVLLPSEILQVKADDGTVLYGRLIKPLHYAPGTKYPLIVNVYGGPGVQVVTNHWSGASWDQMMAQKGYLVFQLDNRGSSGRGHAFETAIFRDLGTHEVADQKAGVDYLVHQGLVDPDRVGITGWSYGGYMTIHSLLLAPETFKVGVSGAPVTDWHNYDTIYTERYMGLPEHNRPHYDASSNVQNAAKLQGQLLIVHNFEDDNVLFQNTMQMANALETNNRPFFMQIYPQKSHGVSGPLRRPLNETMTGFFDDRLHPSQILH